MPQLLEDLEPFEVSLVDVPADPDAEILIRKADEPPEDVEVDEKAAEEIEKALPKEVVDKIASATKTLDEIDLTKLPENAQRRLKLIIANLKSLTGYPTTKSESGEKGEPETKEDVEKVGKQISGATARKLKDAVKLLNQAVKTILALLGYEIPAKPYYYPAVPTRFQYFGIPAAKGNTTADEENLKHVLEEAETILAAMKGGKEA